VTAPSTWAICSISSGTSTKTVQLQAVHNNQYSVVRDPAESLEKKRFGCFVSSLRRSRAVLGLGKATVKDDKLSA